MTKEEIVEFLLSRPSYIKKNNKKKAASVLKISIEELTLAWEEAKFKFSGKASNKLLKYLEEHNLEITDLKKIKIYGNTENPMFSVETKNEWYKQSEKFIEELVTSIKDYKAPVFKQKKYPKSGLAVLNLYDAHIDKIILIDETNPKGDVDTNLEIFEDAFDKLLSQTLVYSPEYIIFPVGNDFFNSNDAKNTTVKGTPQDTNPFWKQSFIKGYEAIRRCIDKANQYCNVFVYMVMSNHDADKLFYLGQLLKATYESNSLVYVEDSTKARKYFQYGNSLLGFGHGDNEKNYVNTLPATIMIENKKIMPDIDYIHYYAGDIHHIEKFQVKKSQDLKGCNITFLRSISDLSKWEYSQGYIGIPKTAESYIFDKEKGLVANLLVHI